LAFEPSAGDRERVFAALLPKLDGSLLGASSSAASGAARGIVVKASAVLVGLVLAGGALELASRPGSQSPKTSVAPPERPRPLSLPAPVNDVPERVAKEPLRVEVPEKRAPRRVRVADNLAQEVSILSQASSELHAGRPAEALKALEEHHRRYPAGALAEERSAARIRALCALGRVDEARSELTRFSQSAPESPHLARARKACGLARPGEG
jgi:hypothetical protein